MSIYAPERRLPRSPITDRNNPQASEELKPWIDRREQAKRDRSRYEATWHLCQAYIANRQWVGWSKRDRRIINEPNPQDRVRHTVNVLTQYLMTNVGKLASDDMRPTLYAVNDSVESQDYTKQANKALEYAWDEELDAEARLYDAMNKMCTFGTAGVQCRWDSARGELIAPQVPFINGKPILDQTQAYELMAQAQQSGQRVEIRDVRGKIAWDTLSPFNILPPPAVEHSHDFPWLIIERPVPVEMIKMVYGPAANGVNGQDLSAVDMMGYRDLSAETEPGGSSAGRLKDHSILSTGYEYPTVEYPKGRTVTWTQNKKLETTEMLPYTVNGEAKIGISFFHYNHVSGRFWGIGCVEPGLGPQRQRNVSRSQYIELKDRAGLGRVYARPGSLNVAQLPGGKVMEVIEVRDGRDYPQETVGLGPGPWMAADIQMHDADLDKVMGLREVSMGGAPAGVSAYSAMALLAEQDDRRIGPILKAIRSEVGWLSRYTIETMRTYWPPNKQIMLAGQNDEVEAFLFNSTKLPPCYLVKVGKGAPAPRNQAGEIQKVFDIYDRAISGGNPLPVSWLWDSLEEGKARPLPTDQFDLQREKAEIENLAMARGAVIQPSAADNHQVHIAEHNAAIAAHQLIPGSEQFIQLAAQHIMAHEQMRAQNIQMAASVPALQGPMGQEGGRPAGAPQGATPGMPPQINPGAQVAPPGGSPS